MEGCKADGDVLHLVITESRTPLDNRKICRDGWRPRGSVGGFLAFALLMLASPVHGESLSVPSLACVTVFTNNFVFVKGVSGIELVSVFDISGSGNFGSGFLDQSQVAPVLVSQVLSWSVPSVFGLGAVWWVASMETIG